MASENVSAFQLYFMDNIENFSTTQEAYIKLEEEWKSLSKNIVYYYMKKEMEVNRKNLYASYIHIQKSRYIEFLTTFNK